MTILVTGATGNVGRLVVEGLVQAGEGVRALTRSPGTAGLAAGAEVVRGDLDRPETLTAALDGARSMYLFPSPATAARVVGLAVEAGVERIVVLSSGAVTAGLDTGFHLPVERAVEASGLAWTHVRPGEFMLNKLWLWGPSIRAEGVVRDPAPDAAGCLVHEQDIADVAVAALLEDGHAGAAYTLTGPSFISTRDQVRALAAAAGREIALERVSPEAAREIYRAQGGFAAANADFLLGFTSYSGTDPEPGAPSPEPAASDAPGPDPLPTAESVTGRPARTFADWARDHAADFRSA